MRVLALAFGVFAFSLAQSVAPQAHAWGNSGHKQTGWIADRVLDDATRQKVHAILGTNLGTASLWADCIRDVDSHFDFNPQGAAKTTCKPFSDASGGKARMEDYARRNWSKCNKGTGCHLEYHYVNLELSETGYRFGAAGTAEHDIVHAINAAIVFLQTGQQTHPFNIRDKQEALFMLAHFTGDLHQPLHVGSIYLDPLGQIVRPSSPAEVSEAIFTRGGNKIYFRSQKLHAYWDTVPTSYGQNVVTKLVDEAREIPATSGPITGWAESWTKVNFGQAQDAFYGMTFGKYEFFWEGPPAKREKKWGWAIQSVVEPPGSPATAYWQRRRNIQNEQLALGGAHLAQLLEALDAGGYLDN